MAHSLSSIAAALLCGFSASAQGPAPAPDLAPGLDLSKPAASRRVAHSFAFDKLPGDSLDLPRFWLRAQHDPPGRIRPGFPIWNTAELDTDIAYAGSSSVRLDTEGGSASLLLNAGVLQIFPDADYALVARVRTDGIEHAHARIAARLADASGTIIPGSEVTSEPVRTGGAWAPVTVRILGDFPEAASLQIELLLEQPGPDDEHPFQRLAVERQDFKGSAWFDELAVVQVPRVEAWVDSPGNLIYTGASPSVGVFLRDLVGEPLDLIYELTDATGQTLAREVSVFEGGRLETTWTPPVDRYGWYQVSVDVERDGARIGSARTSFVWREPRQTDERHVTRGVHPFSITVESVPVTGVGELGDLVIKAGMPRALTSLYHESMVLTRERIEAFGDLANRLARDGAEIGITVDELPRTVSEISGPTPVLRAIMDETADGNAWLSPILVDLGHRIRWWRVGAFGDTLDEDAMALARPAIARLRDLVPGAVLELPWSSFDRVHAGAVQPGLTVAQEIDPSIPPGEIPTLLGDYAEIADELARGGWDAPEHTAVFSVPPRPSHQVLVETVLGAVHAWAGYNRDGTGAPRGRTLRLDGGWGWVDGRRPQLMPTPGAACWLHTLDMLSNRKAEYLSEVAPGVNGALLTPLPGAPEGTDSVAVFWPDPGPDQRRVLTLLLAAEPVRSLDIFGNATEVASRTLPHSTVQAHDIDLSDGVVFVEGVDPELLRFLASVRLEPSLVESNTDPQPTELVMTNSWEGTIQGEYYLVEPGGLSSGGRAEQDRRWQINPRFDNFAIGPESDARLPVSFDISPAVVAGRTDLVVDIDLSSPTVTGFVRVERRIDVGLEHITMDLLAAYAPDPRGEDVLVYAIVENTGTVPENVALSVSAPGFPRQRAAPSPAIPGQRLIKVFAFPEGRSLLMGERVSVGLTIRESGSRLRRAVMIDEGG